MVAGEIFSGILLGPTFLRWIDLNQESIMFYKFDHLSAIFNFLGHISLIFLVFTSGLKINFDLVLKHKKETIYVALCSGLVPFVTGVLVCNYYPHLFDIPNGPFPPYSFSLFFGLALSISALPVIYKILIENNLAETSSGIIILSSAIIIDVVCWILFGLILEKTTAYESIKGFIFCLFLALFLLKTRKIFLRLIKLLKKKFLDKKISLNFCLYIVFGLAFSAEYLGLHSILGAFLAGVIIHSYFDDVDIKNTLHDFVFSFFAPFFFVTIGLKVSFLENFNNSLIIITLILATLSKLLGAFLGTYFSKIKGRDSLIISFALNARGLMEIIISTIALEVGLISATVYVTLIIMAVLTSSISGAALRFLTSGKTKNQFANNKKVKTL